MGGRGPSWGSEGRQGARWASELTLILADRFRTTPAQQSSEVRNYQVLNLKLHTVPVCCCLGNGNLQFIKLMMNQNRSELIFSLYGCSFSLIMSAKCDL